MRVDDVRTVAERVSNWGRWGSADERGTVNYVTPDKLVAAAKLVRKGATFDLGIPFDQDGPQTGTGVRANPLHFMTELGATQLPGGVRYTDDYVVMALQSATQWDALAHVFYDDLQYNGVPASATTLKGATRNGIDKISNGVAGRGVLLDIARLKNVEWLPPGDVITPEDLDDAIEAQGGTVVGSGDILLIRTGWWKKFVTDRNREEWMAGEPGLGQRCAEWLHERQVAALAADNWAIEVVPCENPEIFLPLHMLVIRDMGMTLGEMFDLEELAADCAEDRVYDFFFCAPPLKVTGGVGSPINPLAFK
jgi:kynurenine formamidase